MSGALSDDLRDLTAALDPPRDDLERDLRALIAAIRMSSDSYVGLTLTLVAGGAPYTIVAIERADAEATVRSSALLPLPPLCDVEEGSSIVFYAAGVDAFVDFAIDVSHALEVPLERIELDRHLEVPAATPATSGLVAAALENRAVGVLIDRGRPPAAARAELRRRAAAAGTGLDDAARTVIRSASDEPPQLP